MTTLPVLTAQHLTTLTFFTVLKIATRISQNLEEGFNRHPAYRSYGPIKMLRDNLMVDTLGADLMSRAICKHGPTAQIEQVRAQLFDAIADLVTNESSIHEAFIRQATALRLIRDEGMMDRTPQTFYNFFRLFRQIVSPIAKIHLQHHVEHDTVLTPREIDSAMVDKIMQEKEVKAGLMNIMHEISPEFYRMVLFSFKEASHVEFGEKAQHEIFRSVAMLMNSMIRGVK